MHTLASDVYACTCRPGWSLPSRATTSWAPATCPGAGGHQRPRTSANHHPKQVMSHRPLSQGVSCMPQSHPPQTQLFPRKVPHRFPRTVGSDHLVPPSHPLPTLHPMEQSSPTSTGLSTRLPLLNAMARTTHWSSHALSPMVTRSASPICAYQGEVVEQHKKEKKKEEEKEEHQQEGLVQLATSYAAIQRACHAPVGGCGHSRRSPPPAAGSTRAAATGATGRYRGRTVAAPA